MQVSSIQMQALRLSSVSKWKHFHAAGIQMQASSIQMEALNRPNAERASIWIPPSNQMQGVILLLAYGWFTNGANCGIPMNAGFSHKKLQP